jgi:hypothetical protein
VRYFRILGGASSMLVTPFIIILAVSKSGRLGKLISVLLYKVARFILGLFHTCPIGL